GAGDASKVQAMHLRCRSMHLRLQVDASKVQAMHQRLQGDASKVQVDASKVQPGREGKNSKFH
ncbi:hypothetical protein, partial [Nostoc sp. 'Peltigera malacea cyanobiont' DB3992]|uniref:hypothetical protein n=1 Tax=Nostoc sp. 'Peltigera malacea cyanobiont' DB3992 TaxID=1206980 RepID=UPI000C05E4D9